MKLFKYKSELVLWYLGEIHKDEKVLKVIKLSYWAFLICYILGIIFLIFGTGLLFIIVTTLVRRGTAYYITEKRIIYQTIFLSRKISSVTYDKIQDLHITQAIFGRILGIGTIHINTAGSTFIEVKFLV